MSPAQGHIASVKTGPGLEPQFHLCVSHLSNIELGAVLGSVVLRIKHKIFAFKELAIYWGGGK